jgi:hypothetical protein
MSDQDTPKKRGMRKIDWFILLICVGLIFAIVSNQNGCSLMERTEDTRWID